MGSKAVKFKDNSGNAVYPCPYSPVGSIYMSVNNINPANFFGGKWEQIKDRFLLACGSTYSNGSTGGEANVILENNIYFRPRDKTYKEMKDKIISDNYNTFKDRKYKIYYFYYSNKSLFVPDDDFHIG